MREELKLVTEALAARDARLGVALATVVRVRGSAYRREGAKMMIDERGAQVCMISGGCLEAEVGETAREVLATGRPRVRAFDLDEDLVWGLGLGCGGSVDVYIEPFDERPAFRRWLDGVQSDEAALLATDLETRDRLFVGAEGERVGTLGDERLDAQVAALAQRLLTERYPRPYLARLEHRDVFLDLRVPTPRLVVFGAGHDALPVHRYARDLGFAVSVVDARPAFLTEERFPGATLVRSHPSGFEERVALDGRSSVLVMNHHLERDAASLAFALRSPAPYVGVLGPKKRFEQMLECLAEGGRPPDEAALARVHNPVGLDIGAETPEEIAISILAELTALRGRYGGGFLKERPGPIHTDRVVR